MQIKKIFQVMTSQTSYDIQLEVVINRAKFDVYSSSSFEESKPHVRTHVQIELRFIYIRLLFFANLP